MCQRKNIKHENIKVTVKKIAQWSRYLQNHSVSNSNALDDSKSVLSPLSVLE